MRERDVTDRMPPRMSFLRQVVLVSMAFSVGLFLGLCVHLPSFINAHGQGLKVDPRSPRIPRDMHSPVLEERLAALNSSQKLTPQGRVNNSVTSQPNDISLQAKVKAIREAYDNIRAAKAQQVKNIQMSSATMDNKGQRVYGSRTVRVLVTGRDLSQDENQNKIFKQHVSNDARAETERHSVGSSDVTNLRQSEFTTLEDIVTDGVYWSHQVEALLPRGFTEQQVAAWRRRLRGAKVVGMEVGCGRMQNRRLLLEDGGEACARYRINTDQIQGEVFSYYLARLLHIPNLPPTALAVASSTQQDTTWTSVHQQMATAQWSPEKPVVLTPWLPRLRPVLVPRELRQPGVRDETGNINVHNNLHPSLSLLGNRSLEGLVELVQWSDLIVFDYLNANVDRLVNNMFNLQWNSDMMRSATHNLESQSGDGLLVFFDNESGLFHSYRLLDKYSHYHEALLSSLCVFRASTAAALKRLHSSGSVVPELMALYRSEEPLHWMLPDIPENNAKILENRIRRVVDQIHRCESRYAT